MRIEYSTSFDTRYDIKEKIYTLSPIVVDLIFPGSIENDIKRNQKVMKKKIMCRWILGMKYFCLQYFRPSINSSLFFYGIRTLHISIRIPLFTIKN